MPFGMLCVVGSIDTGHIGTVSMKIVGYIMCIMTDASSRRVSVDFWFKFWLWLPQPTKKMVVAAKNAAASCVNFLFKSPPGFFFILF